MFKILFGAIILIVSIKRRYVGAKLTPEEVLVHAVDGRLALQLRQVRVVEYYWQILFDIDMTHLQHMLEILKSKTKSYKIVTKDFFARKNLRKSILVFMKIGNMNVANISEKEITTLISKVEYLVTHASKTPDSLYGAYLVSCMMEISTHLQVIVDYALKVDRALTVLELGQIPKLLLPPKELKEVLETIVYMLLAEGHFELPNSIDPIDPFYWHSQMDTSSFLSKGHLQIVVQIPLVKRKRNYVLYQTFPTSTEGPVGTKIMLETSKQYILISESRD
ncbi:hypothetical protein QYM36_011558 [Artemia franciscana]|uniref:Uncharacterized protein n=1 Tax=Artemia franciscana TaxID=6661 RepID=A0AA88HMB0_ARTSF|nr:hypothetical protein QYM36_011558 [Artemia franciscana]